LRLINKTLVPVRGETAFSAWIADQVAQEAQENDKRMAERYLAWLSRRERFVVCHVNGFSGKELSFEEIAPKLHKTSEEIKQIYEGAIAKLSKDAREFAEFVERLQLPSASFSVGPSSVN
jgi:DNA-directed RNA polymerase sigma subunit (sigma70/sigma32)